MNVNRWSFSLTCVNMARLNSYTIPYLCVPFDPSCLAQIGKDRAANLAFELILLLIIETTAVPSILGNVGQSLVRTAARIDTTSYF